MYHRGTDTFPKAETRARKREVLVVSEPATQATGSMRTPFSFVSSLEKREVCSLKKDRGRMKSADRRAYARTARETIGRMM